VCQTWSRATRGHARRHDISPSRSPTSYCLAAADWCGRAHVCAHRSHMMAAAPATSMPPAPPPPHGQPAATNTADPDPSAARLGTFNNLADVFYMGGEPNQPNDAQHQYVGSVRSPCVYVASYPSSAYKGAAISKVYVWRESETNMLAANWDAMIADGVVPGLQPARQRRRPPLPVQDRARAPRLSRQPAGAVGYTSIYLGGPKLQSHAKYEQLSVSTSTINLINEVDVLESFERHQTIEMPTQHISCNRTVRFWSHTGVTMLDADTTILITVLQLAYRHHSRPCSASLTIMYLS
jgi:hypothetical protein